MAATKRNAMLHQEARGKIQTTQIINRLQNNGLGKMKTELSTGQIKSLQILLDKKLPDLQAITLEGAPDGQPIRFIVEGLHGVT